MKNGFWLLVIMIALLQLEILGLVLLNNHNLRLWGSQIDFNSNVIGLVTKECISK